MPEAGHNSVNRQDRAKHRGTRPPSEFSRIPLRGHGCRLGVQYRTEANMKPRDPPWPPLTKGGKKIPPGSADRCMKGFEPPKPAQSPHHPPLPPPPSLTTSHTV